MWYCIIWYYCMVLCGTGADLDKEELGNGEEYCIECDVRPTLYPIPYIPYPRGGWPPGLVWIAGTTTATPVS